MMHLTVAAQHGRPYNAAPGIAQFQRRAEVVADVMVHAGVRLPSAEHEQRAEVMLILIQPHPAGRIVECSLKLRVIRQPAGPEASGITLAEQALTLPEKAAGGACK
ncbi:hypothetical protein [Enterobacter soli]|uniref:hypothetical protein n=1 Tax=Enterobacter soli TaxID=885040 RepID=UPI00289A695C|nr:hypothetical protein [Enterobacter soli]